MRVLFLSLVGVLLPAVAVLAQLPPVPSSTDKSAEPQPRLYVAKRLYDIGKIVEGTKKTLTWRLENHGDADLVIDRTKASCGCTIVKLSEDQKVIPPGGSLDLEAEFDSTKRRGTQYKKIFVYTNDPAESQLKLEFQAEVEYVFDFKPAMLNLQGVQRGELARRTLDVTINKSVNGVEIIGVEVPAGVPLEVSRDLKVKDVTRFRFTVGNKASLGSLSTFVTLKVRVNGKEQERKIQVSGEVVGDITWIPKIVDMTRQPSYRGRKLRLVTVRSVDKQPIEILDVSVGSTLDVWYEEGKNAKKGTFYLVKLAVREDAPAGPYGEMITIRTSSLDQPVLTVPVFGIVPPVVTVDPPELKFIQNGSAVGMTRRLKLQARPQAELEIQQISSSQSTIRAAVDEEASARYKHLRYLDVVFEGGLPVGTHESVLLVKTSLPGAEALEIPISILVPK